jgi:dTDP-4-dehydrorhamnose 3,5-epimerase
MTVENTFIKDLSSNCRDFEDSQGYFFEAYNQAKFHEHGIKHQVYKMINHCQTRCIRGLHLQECPFTFKQN